MDRAVEIPLWALVILIAVAVWALFVLLVLPWVRWFFKGVANRAVEQMNRRLDLAVPEFKLTRRQVLVDRLVHDPLVLLAVQRHCAESGERREEVMARVERYAREIVPAFNAWIYLATGQRLARRVVRALYRVRLGNAPGVSLRDIDPEASVVFVMNHRSNMDYVLVGYLAMERVALSYAVGEWARVWPLQQLIRSLGAYFVRRGSGEPLYRRVLERYVQTAVQGGIAQAVFPEGGLSRDGLLREPKLGLLDYMLRDFDPERGRDIVFVPVGINYDRVLEDRTLLLDTDRERAQELGTRHAVRTTLSFIGRNLKLMFKGEWHRFGYACVCFGEPVSLRQHLAQRDLDLRVVDEDARRREVAALGDELMRRIGRVIPVLPVPALAAVLRDAPEGLSQDALRGAVGELLDRLRARGAFVHLPRDDEDYFFRVGLRMLRLRRLIDESGGRVRTREGEEAVMAYYANALAHHGPAEGTQE